MHLHLAYIYGIKSINKVIGDEEQVKGFCSNITSKLQQLGLIQLSPTMTPTILPTSIYSPSLTPSLDMKTGNPSVVSIPSNFPTYYISSNTFMPSSFSYETPLIYDVPINYTIGVTDGIDFVNLNEALKNASRDLLSSSAATSTCMKFEQKSIFIDADKDKGKF